jgi:Tol biopolymer transport system component
VDSPDISHTTSVWSPDASQLLVLTYGNGNAALQVADVATGSLTPVYDVAATSVYPDYPDWSPDGLDVVFAAENDDRDWVIYKLAMIGDSEPEPFLDAGVSLEEHPRDVASPRYSHDGTSIAYYRIAGAGSPGYALWTLVLADATTGEDLVVIPLGEGEPFGNGITSPTWSPDDDRIVVPYQDHGPTGTVQLLYIVDADGTGLRELRQGALSADWRPQR